MAKNSNIEWCDDTGNPWWGCDEVNPACDNCYARVWAGRWGKELWGHGSAREAKKKGLSQFDSFNNRAEREGRKRVVFVGSMMDIFEKSKDLVEPHEGCSTTGELRAELFRRIDAGRYPNLIFLFLTKRYSNILKMIPNQWIGNPPYNVWFGITVATRKTCADVCRWMNPLNGRLRQQTFWSVEPLLEDLDYTYLADISVTEYPSWIICGGESGNNRRPFEIEWAQNLLRFCRAKSIPFFMKQIDKKREIPGDILVREFPWEQEQLVI